MGNVGFWRGDRVLSRFLAKKTAIAACVWSAAAGAMLAGCSGQADSDGPPSQRRADSGPKVIDKEAAALLSLTQGSAEDFESDYARTLACAGAVGALSDRLRGLSVAVGAEEMKLLAQAAGIYRRQARTYGETEGISANDVTMALDEALEAAREPDAATVQTQLSISCLQQLDS